MQSLQAQIRQLKADNASLATAAEQAAALAEEYAADAAKYRAANNSSQTALVNELTDATRRKDRRIQRLTGLLETEKKRTEDMQCRIEQLEQLKRLTHENENKLRDSLRALQEQPLAPARASGPTGYRLPVKVLSALEAIFPPDLRSVFAAFRVLFLAESVCLWTSRIALTQKAGKAGGGFAQLAKVIDETARRAVAWCFDSPAELAQRGIMLEKGMTNLEERVETLSRKISEGEPHRWTPEYAQMKQDLVAMPVEVVKSVVPASWSRVLNTHDTDFEKVCRQQADRMKSILTNEEREMQAKIVEDLKSKLNATRLMLEQRNRELDDLRVRTSVFENKLGASLKDKENITELQAKVKTLETELAAAKVATEQSHTSERIVKEGIAEAEKSEKQGEPSTVLKQLSLLEKSEQMSETAHLRRMLVRSQLADLRTATSLSRDEDAQLRETMQLRDAIRTALNDARIAASTARVVQLNPQTLKPKIEGTTMSRKTILQSLSALEKPTGAAQLQQYLTRFATKREVKLYDAANVVNTLVTMTRDLR